MRKRMRAKVWIAATALVAALALGGCGGQQPAGGGQQPASSKQAAGGISPEEVAKFWELSQANHFLMSADDLKKALDAGEDIFILDVRLAKDYAEQGHIPGAVNIPYPEVGKNLDKLPKDKKIVAVCYTGHQAGNTSAWLRVLGYNSYNLRFGMSGWNPNNNKLLPKDQTPQYPTVTGSEPGKWQKQ